MAAWTRGGFSLWTDARSFTLGIDWVRAEAGYLIGITTQDVDRERCQLDIFKAGASTEVRMAMFVSEAVGV